MKCPECNGTGKTYNPPVTYEYGILSNESYSTCNFCKGSGSAHEETITCSVCNGRGHPIISESITKTKKYECRHCSGKGRCSSCNGKGSIRQYVDEKNYKRILDDITCQECSGTGRCNYCQGNGSYLTNIVTGYNNTIDYNNKCYYCKGSGSIKIIKPNSPCFITTATLQSLGKQDDCEELKTFRNYRDVFLKDIHPEDIKKYYEIAPSICLNINNLENKKDIYQNIWTNHLKQIYHLIKDGKNYLAYKKYRNMVIELENEYLK